MTSAPRWLINVRFAVRVCPGPRSRHDRVKYAGHLVDSGNRRHSQPSNHGSGFKTGATHQEPTPRRIEGRQRAYESSSLPADVPAEFPRSVGSNGNRQRCLKPKAD